MLTNFNISYVLTFFVENYNFLIDIINNNTNFDQTLLGSTKMLTIYNNITQCVEKRCDTQSVLVPLTTDDRSIMVHDCKHKPLSFILNNPSNDGYIINARKHRQNLYGQYKTWDGNSLVLKNDKCLTFINDPDIVSGLPDLLHKQLVLDRCHNALYLSYLFNDLSWKSVINMVVRSGGGISQDYVNIFVMAIIKNNLKIIFEANVVLAAGDIASSGRQTFNPESRSRGLAPASMMVASSQSNESGDFNGPTAVEDIFIYELGKREIGIGESHIVLSEFGSNVSKLYKYRVGNNNNMDEKQPCRFGYRFDNTEYLPSSAVYVYFQEKFIGSTTMTQKAPGQRRSVWLGQSSLVTCSDTVERSENRTSDTEVTVEIIITIKCLVNIDTNAELIMEYYLGGVQVDSFTPDNYSEINGDLFSLTFPLVTNTRGQSQGLEQTFECIIQGRQISHEPVVYQKVNRGVAQIPLMGLEGMS